MTTKKIAVIGHITEGSRTHLILAHLLAEGYEVVQAEGYGENLKGHEFDLVAIDDCRIEKPAPDVPFEIGTIEDIRFIVSNNLPGAQPTIAKEPKGARRAQRNGKPWERR